MSKIARTIAMKLRNRQEFKRSRYNSVLNKDTSLEIKKEYNTNGNEIYCLYYANNEIATLDDSYLYLDNCGYKTRTTKKYLNNILLEFGINCSIVQRNFIWYLDVNGKLYELEFPLIYDIAEMRFTKGFRKAEFETKLKQYD